MRRLAIWAFFVAVLLIVVPVSFRAGERYECQTDQQVRSSKSTPDDSSTLSFDPCTMVDAGMLPWMRWSFDSGVVMLCVGAWAFGRSREKRKERLVGEIQT